MEPMKPGSLGSQLDSQETRPNRTLAQGFDGVSREVPRRLCKFTAAARQAHEQAYECGSLIRALKDSIRLYKGSIRLF